MVPGVLLNMSSRSMWSNTWKSLKSRMLRTKFPFGGNSEHLWTPIRPKLGTQVYLPYSLCYHWWKKRTFWGPFEGHIGLASWRGLFQCITCVGKLEYSPHKSLLFFVTTLLREPRVKPIAAKFPDSNALQKQFLLFIKAVSLNLYSCQTTSFFTSNALACWSHLFFLDFKSPSPGDHL